MNPTPPRIPFLLSLAIGFGVLGCGLPNPMEPGSPVNRDALAVFRAMDRAKSGIFPANMPDGQGALGRNKKDGAYSTVRWQMDLLPLVIYGLVREDAEAASMGLLAVEYGQNHQGADGGFLFSPIAGVSQTPTVGDLASGAAFYLSMAGTALVFMDRSSWIQDQPVVVTRMGNLSNSLARSLDYLMAQENRLMAMDAEAPNRLLFDALAFMSLSLHLSNGSGIPVARKFTEKALGRMRAEGWFQEGNGYDSSYQAVGAMNLFFLALLDGGLEQDRLFEAFYRATAWEGGRITPWGEVSVVGNSRVFPGGESFLGSEKEVAALSVAQAFFGAGAVFEEGRFLELGNRVTRHYFRR